MPKRTAKNKRIPSTQVLILLTTGILLILFSTAWNFYQSRVLSFSLTEPILFDGTDQLKKASPEKILIPNLAIELPVVESQIKNGVWEINPKGGSHLASSANPGESGNIVIYGHNRSELFGRTLKLKVGDQIKIISTDSEIHSYQIYETKVVNPTEVSVLLPTPEETLTFYTCTGLLDSKRFVIKARPTI